MSRSTVVAGRRRLLETRHPLRTLEFSYLHSRSLIINACKQDHSKSRLAISYPTRKPSVTLYRRASSHPALQQQTLGRRDAARSSPLVSLPKSLPTGMAQGLPKGQANGSRLTKKLVPATWDNVYQVKLVLLLPLSWMIIVSGVPPLACSLLRGSPDALLRLFRARSTCGELMWCAWRRRGASLAAQRASPKWPRGSAVLLCGFTPRPPSRFLLEPTICSRRERASLVVPSL